MRLTDYKKSGSDYKVTCPQCGGKYKMYINFEKGIYHCFRCDDKGRLNKELIRQVPQAKKQAPTAEQLPLESVAIVTSYEARTYLQGRKIIPDPDWRYCHSGKYYNRILIPITCFGKYWGFQARSIDPYESYRYLSSKGLPIHKMIWGWDRAAATQPLSRLIVTEGVFAAKWINQQKLGYSAIAAFTKRLSDAQASTIATRYSECVLAFDIDAEKQAIEAGWMLYRYGLQVKIMQMQHKGPDDHTVDEFINLPVIPLLTFVGTRR